MKQIGMQTPYHDLLLTVLSLLFSHNATQFFQISIQIQNKALQMTKVCKSDIFILLHNVIQYNISHIQYDLLCNNKLILH